MIQKWLLIFITLVIGVLAISTVGWFETKQAEVETVTQSYRDTLQELQNIKQTNQWLKEVVIPYFSTMPLTKGDAELDMIRFYDAHFKKYNFRVSRFIYYDDSAKMDIAFSFIPKNQDDIYTFLALRYPNGFLQIQTLASKEGSMSGIITIIQPMKGVANASGQ
jgi:hypothetical protein